MEIVSIVTCPVGVYFLLGEGRLEAWRRALEFATLALGQARLYPSLSPYVSPPPPPTRPLT